MNNDQKKQPVFQRLLTILGEIFHHQEQTNCPTSKKNLFIHAVILNGISLLCGGVFTFAFAPYQLYFFAYFVPAIFLLLILKARPKQAFFRGLFFGLGFFTTGVWWIYISIHVHGHTALPLALLLTGLFMLILALFPAVLGGLLQKYFSRNSTMKIVLAFPAGWILLEWIRSWFLSGFPWLQIGYSQIHSPLRGFAPVLGIYGVSFLTLLISSLCVLILLMPKKIKIISALSISTLFIVGFSLCQLQWTTPQNNRLSVSLVQGNVSQQSKWNPNAIPDAIRKYYELTLPQWGQDLIIWPESAIPLPLWVVQDDIQTLNTISNKHNSALILGIPKEANDEDHFYNSMMVLGNGTGTYLKSHLVPFGEYLPFESYLRGIINFFNIPMSSFITSKAKQENLFAKDVIIAPSICYEIAYPELILRHFPTAQLLLTISDDSWFGKTNASFQHLEMGQMRALETGRYLLFATNDGITAIINPLGKIIAKIPQFESTVLKGSIYPMDGITPFMSYGIKPILILIALLLVYCLAREQKI